MKTRTRVKMVRAMDFIVRQCNDEDVIVAWLVNGVADGDCEFGDSYIAANYCDDDAFGELMGCFLRRMYHAYRSGGLYCDKVISQE